MDTSGHVTTWLCSRCKAIYTEQRERCVADGRRVILNLRGVTFGGRWVIERLLGVGGDGGSVWQAAAPPGERDVAIKVLSASDDTAAQRFERGARISGMIDHRHITRVIEHGKAGAWFYLVMELLEGETLQRHLARVKRLPAAEVASFADQILQALEYTHGLNVMHRDLKPANVFVCSGVDGRHFFKLLDFGISKHFLSDGTEQGSALGSPDVPLSEQDGEDEGERLHITEERQILGTPEYMAPEQITGGSIDSRADLYGLGVLLYRMAAGRLPFEAKTRAEMYRRHICDPPPPFPAEAEIPAELAQVIMRALAKHTSDRWSSATAMRQAIIAARSTLTLTPTKRSQRPTPAPEIDPIPTGNAPQEGAFRGRKKGLGLWALAGGAVIAAIAFFLITSGPPTSKADPMPGTAMTSEARPASQVAVAHDPAPAPVLPEAAPAAARSAESAPVAQPTETPPPAVPPEAREVAFNLTSGGVAAQVYWSGRSMGTTPLLLSVKESDLPLEVSFKRGGYRTATRQLTVADNGRDINIAMVHLAPTKRAEPKSKAPGGEINLQR